MHKTRSVPENEIHKIFRDLEIQTDHPIQDRRPDQVWINKKKEPVSSGIFLFQQTTRRRWKKLDKYYDLTKMEKKLGNMKATMIPILIEALWTISKNLKKRLDELEIRGSATKIGQDNQKSLADIRSHVVT